MSMSPDDVIDHLYFKTEEMHKWNPTVKKVKVCFIFFNSIISDYICKCCLKINFRTALIFFNCHATKCVYYVH